MKRLGVSERIKMAKLFIAHSRNDKQEVVRLHFDELGYKTKKLDRNIAYLYNAFTFDRNTKDVCGDMAINTFSDWIEAQDPIVTMPDEYLMVSRLSILLRGMGNAFGIQMIMSKMWEHDAKRFLKHNKINY